MSYISDAEVKNFLVLLSKNNKTHKFEELKKLKLNGDRAQYNIILKHIKENDDEANDTLYKNANLFKDTVGLHENVIRIIDYVLLEIPRAKDYNRLKYQIVRSDELLRKLNATNRENEKTIGEHENKMGKMQGEFISILSIFSAVIIAFFGGISVLGSSLENIAKASHYRLLFTIILIGFVMFNVIYMLLYTISKITSKPIGISLEPNRCIGCKKSSFMSCLAVKYPIVFVYNSMTVLLLSILFLMYIVDKYNFIWWIITCFKWIPDSSGLIPILGGIMLFILVLIIFLLWQNVFKKKFICEIHSSENSGQIEHTNTSSSYSS